MKKFYTLCLLALVALCGVTSCKEDPAEFNNIPEVFVDEATDLLRTSAVLTGRILAPANAMIREYGFKVSSTSDFTSADTDVYRYSDEESLASFSQQITNLKIGHTYFYVAYATNGLDVMTSTLKTFTTPTRSGVLLSDFRLVDEATATFSARVGDTGGSEIHGVGFCWATDDTPTTYDETVLTTLNSDNTFTASLSGLEAGKTYYVRAFADSDILGDGTTQTISYSRDVLEIRLEEELPEPEPASNEIWYTSTDGDIVMPYDATGFGANIVSNTYENGQGVILFDGPVTSIGDEAFYECPGLTSVTIPDSVTSIGVSAFAYCTCLTSVTIPDSVTSIGVSAFACCTCLTSVTIPDSVTEIGAIAFYYCAGLTAFYGKFASSDNRCLIVDGTLNSFAPSGLTEYTIPDSVTSIGEYAFYNCTGLTSVTIPDSVTSIGWGAFMDCTGLASVTIGNNVTSIGDEAFYECTGLTSVTIGNGVTSIGVSAFAYCTCLASVTIGNNVTSIGDDAFGACTALASVYCEPTTPPIGARFMFYGNASGRKIYVPNESVEAYKSAVGWSSYADAIVGYDF